MVASRRESRVWKLDSFDDQEAHLSINDEKMTVPVAEVFDVRKVINIANHILNLGFWAEGLECEIITIR